MNSSNVLKYFLLLLFFTAFSSYADDSSSETYSFFDEVTGLSIDLPKNWERRNPNEIKQALVEINEMFWQRPASEGLSKSGVIFMAFANPYSGSENNRSFLSCVGSPVLPEMKPSHVKLLLETNIQSTFGRYERDVTISEASKFHISGKEAYRLSVLKDKDAPGSFLFVGLLSKDRLIICSGGYDSTFKSAVERSLASIRFK